jgi:hypothetical protein
VQQAGTCRALSRPEAIRVNDIVPLQLSAEQARRGEGSSGAEGRWRRGFLLEIAYGGFLLA